VAPFAYPEIHHVMAPLRAQGRRVGDADLINLWAGEAHALAQERPAAAVVAQLAREAAAALEQAQGRIARPGAELDRGRVAGRDQIHGFQEPARPAEDGAEGV
jgi:hypothetical protein